MKKLSTNQLRQLWINFFKSKNHYFIKPQPLVPKNDDSILWINSGVATLKDYFDGSAKPPKPRLVNSQPSIRTSDIENVGVTARHHTLFEMLGNFSIGEYFKKEAILWAWEFLTDKKWLGFNPEKLYITVFKDDKQAFDIWAKDVGIDKEKIILGEKNTNFWEIGKGPCGPNTEIFYDRGSNYDPKNIGLKLLKEDIENDRYLEVWNIVFSQYNNLGNGKYQDLPMQNIDTGMGLERVASVLQGVPTNYDTDQFQIIIKEIEKHSKYKYDYKNFFIQSLDQEKINIAYKAIADHIKCNVFAISDGAIPSNEKRGYVLRRLLRRAINMGRNLGIKKPFLASIVDCIVDYNKSFFPKLVDKKDYVKKVIDKEERQFLKTLNIGHRKLKSIMENSKNISGKDAFLLFNSYGFPIELTQEIASNNNKKTNVTEFDKLFKKHKEIAKKTYISKTEMAIQSSVLNNFNINSTFDYELEEIKTPIVAIIKDDKLVDKAIGKMWVALKTSIFYIEKGGQISDQGQIDNLDVLGLQFAPNGTHLHLIDSPKEIKIQDEVKAKIWDQRFYLRAIHSGSHLIHQVIHNLYGKDSNQAGKFVGNKNVRFDFNCLEKLKAKDAQIIEKEVNKLIKENNNCKIEYMPFKKAIDKGAIALFSEKYQDEVRTVKIGKSFELCGGTHVKNSKEIERFILTKFGSIGAGVYRVEGVFTNKLCKNFESQRIINLKKDYEIFIVKHKDKPYFKEFDFSINEEITSKYNEYKKAMSYENKKYFKSIKEKVIKEYSGKDDSIIKVNNHSLLAFKSDITDVLIAKEILLNYVNKHKNLITFWASYDGNKFLLVLAIGKESSFSAREFIKKINQKFKTKGGGSASFAQAASNSNIDFCLLLEYFKECLNE